MRYFYYGTQKEPTAKNRQTPSQTETSSFQELVEEEDTVYEVDRACMECQKRIQERKGSANTLPW